MNCRDGRGKREGGKWMGSRFKWRDYGARRVWVWIKLQSNLTGTPNLDPMLGLNESSKANQCGKYLHKLVQDKLGDTKLHQTLTNVVIPTFDIKYLQPVIFSSYKLKRDPTKDALLSDICISTSAAPTFLPAHHFETKNEKGEAIRSFDLIDGGVCANHLTLVAVSEVSSEMVQQNPDFFAVKATDYGRFLAISLGTGSAKDEHRYNAESAAKWGMVGWLVNGGSSPLIDTFTQSSGDMVDFHLSVVFQATSSEKNYLRIQENLANLVKAGESLLNKPVSRVNLETGGFEPAQDEGTNKDALVRYIYQWFLFLITETECVICKFLYLQVRQ
ncbi:Patatin-like protein 2 [Nymphaea thermarum]|nr:Patatin-like protein 2 [Nymphaea thermarum]